MLRGRGGVDDALADFDRGWRVGAFNETAAAYRNEGSFGVGKIHLVLRMGSWPRGFVLAARVASRAGQITILLGAGFRVGLDLGARLSQFGFAFLTTLHLGGDR